MSELKDRVRKALEDPEFRKLAEKDPEQAARSLPDNLELSDADLDGVSGGLQKQQQTMQLITSLLVPGLKATDDTPTS